MQQEVAHLHHHQDHHQDQDHIRPVELQDYRDHQAHHQVHHQVHHMAHHLVCLDQVHQDNQGHLPTGLPAHPPTDTQAITTTVPQAPHHPMAQTAVAPPCPCTPDFTALYFRIIPPFPFIILYHIIL